MRLTRLVADRRKRLLGNVLRFWGMPDCPLAEPFPGPAVSAVNLISEESGAYTGLHPGLSPRRNTRDSIKGRARPRAGASQIAQGPKTRVVPKQPTRGAEKPFLSGSGASASRFVRQIECLDADELVAEDWLPG